MTASLAQTSATALLAGIVLFSLSAAAQPGLAPTSRADREIALTGATDEPPAVVYGAPYLPLMVSFDAPVKKDAAVAVQGAEVRPHAFLPDALVITPSSFLTAQSPALVPVPLADGMVVLKLAFSAARRDTSVRVVRRASSARPTLTDGEQRALLSYVATTALDSVACASAGATAVPRRVDQERSSGVGIPLVCDGGAFAYVRVTAAAGCMVTAARLTRGDESAAVLLVQPTTAQCKKATCWLVVARAPDGDGLGFELELLGQDDVPCHSELLDLKPRSP